MLKTFAPTELMSKDEWRKIRARGIGGSDVAAVCGINKYKSVFQLWAEKTGNSVDEEQSEPAYWGTVLESVVRTEFIKKTGFTVTTCPAILQHPDYAFMLANVDGFVNTDEGTFVFEAKTASAWLADEWENGIPYPYMLQSQHYMTVTDTQGAYVAVLIGGNQFRYYFIERDNELIDMLISLEKDFWTNHVENNTPPPIDGSDAAKAYINSLFPTGTATKNIILNDSCIKLIDDFESYQAQEKYYCELKERSANELKLLIGDNESATIGNRLITWKNVSQERLDSKRLASEQPEIYQQYLSTSSYRRFTIKSVKEESRQ